MEEMTLSQWTVNFVKTKDVFQRKLLDYKENGDTIIFNFKDGPQAFLIKSILDAAVVKFASEKGARKVVCSSDQANLKFLISNWKSFAGNPHLTFIFVRLSDNAKWLINPYVHSRVCDDEALVLGLNSMYSSAFQAQDY